MAKAPAKKAPDTGTSTTVSQTDTATINLDKGVHGGTVEGAVNGQRFSVEVGSDQQVTAEQLEALNNSHAVFSTVSPLAGEDAAEGSAASSTVEGTAFRLDIPTPRNVDADGNLLPAPELRQITDKELTEGADQRTSKDSVEANEK